MILLVLTLQMAFSFFVNLQIGKFIENFMADVTLEVLQILVYYLHVILHVSFLSKGQIAPWV